MRITKAHDYDLTGELIDVPVGPVSRPAEAAQLLQVLR
jgi:hypothetical protein